MKITLELLLKKGLDLETATVIYNFLQLFEYDNQFLDEEGLNEVIRRFKK